MNGSIVDPIEKFGSMNKMLEESTSQLEDVLRKMDKDMKEDMKRR